MNILLSLGLILIIGLIATKILKKIKLPAITAYLLLGIFIGPFLLNLIADDLLKASGLISNVALSFIAFGMGQNFSKDTFKRLGKVVLWVSILEAIGAWLLVSFALLFLKLPIYICIVFGAIATASAPAALMMIIRQYRAKGEFTETLMGVVALDDAWGLIIFSVSIALARALYLHIDTGIIRVVFSSLIEIIGAFLLAGAVGFVFNKIASRVQTQVDTLVIILGVIFFTAGMAKLLGLSLLLACMFLGIVVVNIIESNSRYFESLRSVDWPIYQIFFVLSGANLELPILLKIGLIGTIYLFVRVAGKYIGTLIGCMITKAGSFIRKYLILGLLPQAGIALGMALIVKDEFPDYGNMIFTAIAATTVIYELVGPVFVRIGLERAGELT
ncbi:MAG: cation:proton antiporter [Candidatus Omnitrophota bacterium]